MTNLAQPADAAHLLALLPARPRVLALGEPTHGSEALLELRNDLFRQLVEEAGYRTVAVESDCLRGLLVDDHVTTGAGDLDDVVARGFSHGWGGSAANRALVGWMREHNAGRPAAEQVRFAGVDGPLEITHAESPRQALAGLHAYLAERVDPGLLPCTAERLDDLLGADARWTEPAAVRDPSRSAGGSPSAERLRLLADDLVALLEAQAPHLAATPGLDRARLHGRTAAGLLRYHRWTADPSPARLSWLLAVRSSMIAANVLALADRGPTLVHAHAAHLQRPQSSMRMGGDPVRWWSAGAIVGARLGAGYAVVGTALGTFHAHGVGAPAPDTLEGLLHGLPGARSLLDPRRAPGGLAARVSPWFGYAPLDPAQVADLDAIAYVRDA